MKLRMQHIWTQVRSTFWFVPALMVVGAVALASGLIYLDGHLSLRIADVYPRLFGTNAEGARSILSAIAGSMITVAGVTFSVTIVALSLASNQYSPRILRNFMRDRGNQLVLGMFVSVFVYCVLVLRTIRGGDEEFVPSYALTGGMVLGLGAIGFLIYFVHHISASIQASTILAHLYRETIVAMDVFVARHSCVEPAPHGIRAPSEEDPRIEIAADSTGYVQDVDEQALLAWANKHDVVLAMTRGAGDFVVKDAPVLKLYGGTAALSGAAQLLRRCYSISRDRTIEQDPAYGPRQIVDIALKALSPGINDSTTAITCVDYLGAIAFRLLGAQFPSNLTCSGGKLRLVARRASLEHLLDLSLTEIRQHARSNVLIHLSLLRTLTDLARAPLAHRHFPLLWHHVCVVAQGAAPHLATEVDRDAFNDLLARAASVMHQDDRPHRLPRT